MEIREIFENRIKIEPKVMSIESLFNNEERVLKTNYKPSYQRNYVWDDEKATYFIESILLGTEIPPLIYFRNSNKVEVIDGRQRYETILRFIQGDFKLRKNGLQKLDNIGIANKAFKDIGSELQDLFWDTKLRIIEFSFHSRNLVDEENEELVKKEIFKRYNSGITPLKPTEIDNAVYFEDNLNTFIKEKLQNDRVLYRDILNVLQFDKPNTEIILKKIRQLLVQHMIPIKYYAVKKETVIAKFYEFLFANIDHTEIENTYNSLIRKVNILTKVKKAFPDNMLYNRLVSECVFWAMSILENEGHSLKEIDDKTINDLVYFLFANINHFSMVRSSFAKELFKRYETISIFFNENFKIDFTLYLQHNAEFKQWNNDITLLNDERVSFDELRINKPEPSSIAIVDICRQMQRQRFLIRPPYQRNEVINKKKSSAIIESILLGIKLPPIFVFKREDEISEVLDGQQRLLSILGFIQQPYLDENNESRDSVKNGFALNLKNSILSNLNGKRFEDLTLEQQDKIKNFDLWIIEINYKNNNDFEPIDLFIRLNNKPYPIKEDTFEMWNSYISRDIIETIKSVHRNHRGWFYLRKNNSRMEDENIYTALSYFQYNWIKSQKSENYIPKEIGIYKTGNKIYFRISAKNEISRLLENTSCKNDIIEASNEFEFNFIRKLKSLLSNEQDSSIATLNKNLDSIFMIENGRRTQQGYYALWFFLFDLDMHIIIKYKASIREALKVLFSAMSNIESIDAFNVNVRKFKSRFNSDVPHSLDNSFNNFVSLGDISEINLGISLPVGNTKHSTLRNPYPYISKSDFKNFEIPVDKLIYIEGDEINKESFDDYPKLLIKRLINSSNRYDLAVHYSKLAYSSDLIGINVTRSGFLPEYVFAVLLSRYTFYHSFIKNDLFSKDFKPLSMADLKMFQIPVIPLNQQKYFVLMIKYLVAVGDNINMLLFFERIIDSLLYEVLFKLEFREAGVKIMEILKDIPNLDFSESRNANYEQVAELYKALSEPNHVIGANLLRMRNLYSIKRIENLL